MIKSSEQKLVQMQHWTKALTGIFVDQHCKHQYSLSTQRKRRDERQADRTNLPRACAVLIQQRRNNASPTNLPLATRKPKTNSRHKIKRSYGWYRVMRVSVSDAEEAARKALGKAGSAVRSQEA